MKHRSNFPKFAVSPENLVTSQTAFLAPCWFPYSAFLEVTSARPSSGLSASTCGPPVVHLWSTCLRAGCHCSLCSPNIASEWHGGRPPRLPQGVRLRRKAPARGARILRPTRGDARRPGGPQAPPRNPYRGDTRRAPPSPRRRTSELA